MMWYLFPLLVMINRPVIKLHALLLDNDLFDLAHIVCFAACLCFTWDSPHWANILLNNRRESGPQAIIYTNFYRRIPLWISIIREKINSVTTLYVCDICNWLSISFCLFFLCEAWQEVAFKLIQNYHIHQGEHLIRFLTIKNRELCNSEILDI